jgi:hypothetical protein
MARRAHSFRRKFVALDGLRTKLSCEELDDFLRRKHIGVEIEGLKTVDKNDDGFSNGYHNSAMEQDLIDLRHDGEDFDQSSLRERYDDIQNAQTKKPLPRVLPPITSRSSSARCARDPVPQSARRRGRGRERFFYDPCNDHSTDLGVQGHVVIVPPEPRKLDAQARRGKNRFDQGHLLIPPEPREIDLMSSTDSRFWC